MKFIPSGLLGCTGRAVAFFALVFVLNPPAFADDTAKLASIIAPSIQHSGSVTIPPGAYELDGTPPLTIASHPTVFAYGARFHFPRMLGDKVRVVLFAGTNVTDFRWLGGHFTGHVFDR